MILPTFVCTKVNHTNWWTLDEWRLTFGSPLKLLVQRSNHRFLSDSSFTWLPESVLIMKIHGEWNFLTTKRSWYNKAYDVILNTIFYALCAFLKRIRVCVCGGENTFNEIGGNNFIYQLFLFHRPSINLKPPYFKHQSNPVLIRN